MTPGGSPCKIVPPRNATQEGHGSGSRKQGIPPEDPAKQPPLGLERGQPLEGVEKGLPCDPAGDGSLPELPLRIDDGIEKVWVAWPIRVITEGNSIVPVPVIVTGFVAGNDRLHRADLAVTEGIGGLGR